MPPVWRASAPRHTFFRAMLSRSITLAHGTALVVGIIVGASIFVQPSLVAGAVPTIGGVYAVWIVCGILTLFGALIAAELASAYPHAGGVYVFLREAYSPAVAFLWGWAMFWIMHTGIIAVIAMVFARYAAFFVPAGDAAVRPLAVGAVIVLTAVNYLGVRHGSVVQTALTVAKLAAIAAIIVAAFAVGPAAAPPVAAAAATAGSGSFTFSQFLLAVIAGLFAFGGWHMVTYAAEETRRPERTIPRALVIGVLVVTACYLGLNAAYFHLLSPARIAASTRVGADAADAMFGRGGATVLSAVVAVSALGALNGVILAGPRVYLAMARDRMLFAWVAAIHPRFSTPHRALLLQAGWAVVLVCTGTYGVLFTRVVYTEWIFFALMALAVPRLRRRAAYAPAWRVRGGPVVPLVFTFSAACIVVNQIAHGLRNSLPGLALVAAGLAVHAIWLRGSSAAASPSTPASEHAD